MADFKTRLYELRSAKGMSQAELARAIGISAGSIGMYESGARMPSRSMMERLCDYFNVSLDYMSGKEDRSAYYLDPETAQIAQEVYDDPDLRILFDAARDSKPEDIKMAAEMLKRFKGGKDE